MHSIIRDIPKPVIAAVNGYAIGGGHVLHVICDLTIAADTARFGQVGPKVGSVDPGFGTAYLARVVGEKKAREFWYLCEQYTAEECRQLGLVNKVVPAAELMDAAMAWAQRIVDMSPTAIKIAKQSFNTDTESIRAVGALGHQRAGAVLRHRRGDGGPAGVHRTTTARLPPVSTMSDPHAELRDAVRQICAKFPDEYWRQCDDAHEFPWDFYRAFADAGWVGIAIPEEYGGGGAGITEASILLEEIAASGACLNGCSAIHLSVFGMNPVVNHGTEAMKATYLPQVAAGELHVSFGVTEPDAGTDTTNISTRATKVDGGWRIRGRKIWNTKAHIAEKCLLLARTTPLADVRKRTDGMTLFLADLQVPEVDDPPDPQARAQRRRLVRGVVRRPVRRRRRRRRRGRPRLPPPARRAQPRAHPARRRGARHRAGGDPPGRRLRQRARRVRPADRPEPGHRLPARRRPHAAAARPSS